MYCTFRLEPDSCSSIPETMSSKYVQMLEEANLELEKMSFQASDRDRSMAAFESLRRSVVFLVRSDDQPTRRAVDDLTPKEDFLEFFHALHQKYPSCHKRIGEVLKALSVSADWAMVLQEDCDFCAEYALQFSPRRSQGGASSQSCTSNTSSHAVFAKMEAEAEKSAPL